MYRTPHRLLLAMASAGALLLPAQAWAGQASTSFQVTASVGVACTLTAADLAFGTYTGAAVSSQTAIMIDCGSAVPAGSLTLVGAVNGGIPDGFVMADSSFTNGLDYDLYRDATHGQQIFSNQDFPVGAITGAATIPIFGEIYAGQAPADGSYADTVSVIFNF